MTRAASLLCLALLAWPGLALAESVVAGLSQKSVSITANFVGSEILVFGAVKREAPPPDSGPLHVIVTIASPSDPVVVRRKKRIFGIWANADAVEVDAAPSFYAIATSGPFSEIISDTEDLRHKISIDRMIRSVGAPQNITDSQSFTDALIRIRSGSGLYSESSGIVNLVEETLFETRVSLPANLIEGDYLARIFLTRDRQVIDRHETSIKVQKVGLERWIYLLAHRQPFIYGVLSIAIAIFAGWLASAAFRFLRF